MRLLFLLLLLLLLLLPALQPTVGLYFAALLRALASSHTKFLDYTQRRATVSRTPLDEWYSPSQRPLHDNSQHSQQTNIHALGGIRIQNLSRRAAVDLRVRPRGHLDRHVYTGCPRRNVPDFRRVFLMLKYTDITQNTYVQIWTVTEVMAREFWNFDSCYTLIDYQIHIKTGRNMWFL